MLKKVHILSPSDAECTEKKHIQCTVCKNKAKSVLYVCDSGHVICNNCETIDTTADSNEGGDYIPQKDFGPDEDQKEVQSKCSNAKTQDLASGDHDGTVNLPQRTKSDVEKDSTIDDTTSINKKETPKSIIEAIIKYKNPNYLDSKTSVTETSTNGNSENAERRSKEEDNLNFKTIPRPVMCPVTNCSKMVTLDSLMLHFHFDHSKVPKIALNEIAPQEVSLKSTVFSTEVQCIATFIIENCKRPSKIMKNNAESSISSVRNSLKDSKMLLLMAVRLSKSPIKMPHLKFDASRVFTRTIHTQTKKFNANDFRISTESLSKSTSDYKSCISKSVYDDDEFILLWLCKLDDEEKVYSITLLGEDKRRGYCYIGDAIHVRDKQDPSSLYNSSECLIVKGSAVSSLYDNDNQITAIVSIIG